MNEHGFIPRPDMYWKGKPDFAQLRNSVSMAGSLFFMIWRVGLVTLLPHALRCMQFPYLAPRSD